MMWLFAILLVLALGGIALLAAGRGTPLAEAYDDRPDVTVPDDRPLVGEDLRRVRFSLALRGYRQSEVDALLDRVAAQLELAAAQADARAADSASEPTPAPEAEATPEEPPDQAPENTGRLDLPEGRGEGRTD